MNERRFNVFALCFSLLIIAAIAVKGEPTEQAIIRKAAERNKCRGDDYLILLAIRKAENGKRREFGVMNPKANNLDRQAGWAAATIMNQRKRTPGLCDIDFISALADRYCPPSCDPAGNRNWKKNVWYWFVKYKGQQ